MQLEYLLLSFREDDRWITYFFVGEERDEFARDASVRKNGAHGFTRSKNVRWEGSRNGKVGNICARHVTRDEAEIRVSSHAARARQF